MRDAIKKYCICINPDIIVWAKFNDNRCTGVTAVTAATADKWEISNPNDFSAIMSSIDSGTAVLTSASKGAIFIPNSPWKNRHTLRLFDTRKAGYINNFDSRLVEDSVAGIYRIELTDDEYATLTGVQPSESGVNIDSVIGSMTPGMNVGSVSDNFMNKPEFNNSQATTSKDIVKGHQDITCSFTAPIKSDALITASVFEKECIPMYDAAVNGFTLDAEKRFPSKVIPVAYGDTIGYATIHRDISRQSDEYLQVATKVGTINYHFYEMNNDAYDYYPDILPEVVASNTNLHGMVNLTGKVKIAINGMKNMFNAGDPEENVEMLKKMYANFFLITKFFTITHISWKTGFISALTPNFNQVLIYASVKKKDLRDGLFSFIPIKKQIGISVAGLSRDEIVELERIWLTESKE